MGQTRKDTGAQRAAKQRRGERNACPRCRRLGAISTAEDRIDGALVGLTRACRWNGKGCNYAAYTDFTVSPPVTHES